MPSRTRPTGPTRTSRPSAPVRPSSAQRRRAEAQASAAAARRAVQRRRWLRWGAAAAALAAAITGVAVYASRGAGPAPGGTAAAPEVGGDLHTVFVLGDALYVGGHDAVAVSRNGGRTFGPVRSLAGADAMGWAATGDTVLVGGHPGLYRSSDGGRSFTRVSGAGAVADVHALGGAGATVYLASPQAGVLASADGGHSWQVRNAQAGRSFMGTLLVDPADPQRLIAPDMAGGLTASSDGGRSWTPLGGAGGDAMAAAWDPSDTRQIIAVGMSGGSLSSDGGATWRPISLPSGTTAVSFDPTGRTLYAGALTGQQARTYRSTDRGATWTPTA